MRDIPLRGVICAFGTRYVFYENVDEKNGTSFEVPFLTLTFVAERQIYHCEAISLALKGQISLCRRYGDGTLVPSFSFILIF